MTRRGRARMWTVVAAAAVGLAVAAPFFLASLVHFGSRMVQTGATVGQGCVYAWHTDPWRGWTPPTAGWHATATSQLWQPKVEWLPAVRIGERAGGAKSWYVRVPLWMPAAGLGVVCLAAWRRARRVLPGVCQHCSYDLRDTPGPICPECGRAAR